MVLDRIKVDEGTRRWGMGSSSSLLWGNWSNNISVTLNTYTHLKLEDATAELMNLVKKQADLDQLTAKISRNKPKKAEKQKNRAFTKNQEKVRKT